MVRAIERSTRRRCDSDHGELKVAAIQNWRLNRRAAAVTKLVKWWRRRCWDAPKNTQDPITLEDTSRVSPLNGGKWFDIIAAPGCRYRYSADDLFDYFMSTLDHKEPMHRYSLNAVELARLDATVGREASQAHQNKSAKTLLEDHSVLRRAQRHAEGELAFFIEDDLTNLLQRLDSMVHDSSLKNLLLTLTKHYRRQHGEATRADEMPLSPNTRVVIGDEVIEGLHHIGAVVRELLQLDHFVAHLRHLLRALHRTCPEHAERAMEHVLLPRIPAITASIADIDPNIAADFGLEVASLRHTLDHETVEPLPQPLLDSDDDDDDPVVEVFGDMPVEVMGGGSQPVVLSPPGTMTDD